MTSEGVTSTSYHDDRSADSDWPAQAADSIERAVGSVRDKTTGPALLVARVVVYGIFVVVIGVALTVLLSIAAVRLVDNYLPESIFGVEHTWAAHLIVGLAFVTAGGVLWARRRAGS